MKCVTCHMIPSSGVYADGSCRRCGQKPIMESDSPFASFGVEKPLKNSLTIHVMFCDVCHYVWKAPTETTRCINCKGNGECARSLVSYKTEVRIT